MDSNVDPSIPDEFFTLQSMLTLSGATGAVFVISNGLQRAFNYNPAWLALLIAQLIAVLGVQQSGGSGIDYFVGFVNGFLIYCTAAGATAVGSAAVGTGSVPAQISRSKGAGLPQISSTKRQFLSPWF